MACVDVIFFESQQMQTAYFLFGSSRSSEESWDVTSISAGHWESAMGWSWSWMTSSGSESSSWDSVYIRIMGLCWSWFAFYFRRLNETYFFISWDPWFRFIYFPIKFAIQNTIWMTSSCISTSNSVALQLEDPRAKDSCRLAMWGWRSTWWGNRDGKPGASLGGLLRSSPRPTFSDFFAIRTKLSTFLIC